MKFVCFHSVDAGENIGVPINRVDAVTLGSGDEGEMDSNGFRACVGAGKKAIFPHQHPALNCAFTLVVVYRDVWIFEKSGEGAPVPERVIDGFHQFVGGSEFVFRTNYGPPEALHEGLGFSPSHCQPESGRFILYLPLDFVQVAVDVEHGITNVGFAEFGFEVFAPGVSAAPGFDSLPVFEQGVESAGGVSLDDSFEILEKLQVLVEGEIPGVVEHGDFANGVADVGGDFAFAHVVLERAVLNLNGGVVRFDDGGFEQFLLLHFVHQGERVGGGLHPIALSRARDHHIVTGEYLLLTIVGKSIIKLTDNYFSQEAGTGVATGNGRAGFFGGDNVLFAFGARASFLVVVEDFQGCTHHFELVGKQVADKLGWDAAIGAYRVFWLDQVRRWFVGKISCVFQNMLNACGRLLIGRGARASLARLSGGGPGIMLLGLWSVFALVALFRLGDEEIELGLQIIEQFTKLRVSVKSLLQLPLKLLDELSEVRIFGKGLRVCLSEF